MGAHRALDHHDADAQQRHWLHAGSARHPPLRRRRHRRVATSDARRGGARSRGARARARRRGRDAALHSPPAAADHSDLHRHDARRLHLHPHPAGRPGPALAGERGVSPERHAELMAQFGFDRPLWRAVSRLSRRRSSRATSAPRSRPRTRCSRVLLALPGDARALASAPSARHRPRHPRRHPRGGQARVAVRPADHGTALVGYSMPIFWWGLLLIILFSGTLGWTPVSGRISLTYFFPAGHRLHADRQPAVRQAGRLLVGACVT